MTFRCDGGAGTNATKLTPRRAAVPLVTKRFVPGSNAERVRRPGAARVYARVSWSHQVAADAGDRVRPAVDVELAPDRRHTPRADVADLVGVATRLAPGPQGRAEAELVLQALVVEEVGVARRRGAAGVGAPLSGHDRHATERHGIVAGPLERVGRDRPAGEAARVDVRRVDEVAVVGERRWNAAAAVRPHDRRLEEQQVPVTAGRALGPPDRLQRSAVEVRQRLHLLRAERVRLVHHVVARDRRRTGEATGDVAHHARVAGADADTAWAGGVVPEGLEGGAHGRAQLADTAGHASWGVAVEGGPTGCPVPAQRTREARWADLAATGRERGPPGVLVEVDDGVDPVPGEQADVGRDLVEVGLVVVAGPGLDAGPGHQQPGAVPADAGHAFCVRRGEREGRGEGRAPPVVDVGVDVDARGAGPHGPARRRCGRPGRRQAPRAAPGGAARGPAAPASRAPGARSLPPPARAGTRPKRVVSPSHCGGDPKAASTAQPRMAVASRRT